MFEVVPPAHNNILLWHCNPILLVLVIFSCG